MQRQAPAHGVYTVEGSAAGGLRKRRPASACGRQDVLLTGRGILPERQLTHAAARLKDILPLVSDDVLRVDIIPRTGFRS